MKRGILPRSHKVNDGVMNAEVDGVRETCGERGGGGGQHSPEDETIFQLIEGSGFPFAWHIRVMLEPSFTTISFDRLMIFGGTARERKMKPSVC